MRTMNLVMCIYISMKTKSVKKEFENRKDRGKKYSQKNIHKWEKEMKKREREN